MYFHAYYARNKVVFWENLHIWQKIYTTAGRDGRNKSQLCAKISLKEEEGAHCLQIGAYLTFLISWLIVKERVTGAVKSEGKKHVFLGH